MKFFCRYCEKVEEIIIDGFCSIACQDKFKQKGLCGNCNGRGKVSCQAGGKERCDSCNGSGKGQYTKQCGYS